MPIFDDTRADWNARPSTSPRTSVAHSARTGVSWHWLGPGKGPSAAGSHSACLAKVREWQLFHQGPSRGWKDIGYNVLICQHARAIEGRGIDYSGSHSPGVNTPHIGVQFMVGDGDAFPSAAMVARAIRLRADLQALCPNIRRDWGHRDDPKVSTECPGDAIQTWVHSGGPTSNPTTTEESMSAEDVQKVNDYTKALLLDGYTVAGEPKPSLLAVLVETQRRVSRTEAALAQVAAKVDPAALAAAVAAAINVDGSDLTKDDVKAAVLEALQADYDATVELTPKPQAKP